MNIPPHERQLLAEKCGIGEQYLYQVLTDRKEPSPELCVTIEKESGGLIRRWDLRQKDWHRIWPELVGAEGSPEIQIA
jgi:DNA-binding transcriptional regulator YdaS (Cro superfamily)